MAWNMEQSGRKNTLVGPLKHTSHFSPPDRVITQDMAGANSLQRFIVSIVAGVIPNLSHMPLFLFKLHIRHRKCDSDFVLPLPQVHWEFTSHLTGPGQLGSTNRGV